MAKKGIASLPDAGITRPDKPYQIGETVYGVEEHDKVIADYLKTGKVPVDPVHQSWCADYVNATLQMSGYKGTGSHAARSFLNWEGGDPVLSPRLGDIVIAARAPDDKEPDAKNKGHAGFYYATDPAGTNLMLGGNTSQAVRIGGAPQERVLGYMRPREPQKDFLAHYPKLNEAASPQLPPGADWDNSETRMFPTMDQQNGAVITPSLRPFYDVPQGDPMTDEGVAAL
jgi:uncharacterized protein (TIGR02594 family)